jgi:hypothetical protein
MEGSQIICSSNPTISATSVSVENLWRPLGRQEQKLHTSTLPLYTYYHLQHIFEGPSESPHLYALLAFLDPLSLSPTADNLLDFTDGTSCLYTPTTFSTHYE